MSNRNDLSKSSDRFNNYASGIKYQYKGKLSRKDFFQKSESSYDIQPEENPDIIGKHRNETNFKPSTKQTVNQNEYNKMKKKYNFEEIEEKIEEEQPIEEKENKEKKSKKNNKKNKNEKNKENEQDSETPPKKKLTNIYTEQNKSKFNKNKIIDDEDNNEEEEEENNINKNDKEEKEEKEEKENNNELDIDNNSNESDKEKEKEEPNKKNKNKNKKKLRKAKKESDDDDDNKESKGVKSVGGDLDNELKFKKKANKKNKKWNEEEYQKLLSESKNYIPFKEYDINKFILTLSQMNNIKNNPELYEKYNQFLSLKKKQDKIHFDILLKNILLNLRSIYKSRFFQNTFTVNSLFKNSDFSDFIFKSSEKTAYFDLFISFISMYVSNYESFIESTSIIETKKLVIPLHALAFIFSSQIFFCDIARLMQNYYDKFLSYKIIPIYTKENEEYISKINTRHIIWKQFEIPFLFFKNKKKLYLKGENDESKLDEKKVEEFADQIDQNIIKAYNNFVENIIKKHNDINVFNINDEKIDITDNKKSAPSSLYNQINQDVNFKLEMNLYKYNMKKMKMKKVKILNDAKIKKYEFENKVKNKIFKQSAYYMNSTDVVQDFLENYS